MNPLGAQQGNGGQPGGDEGQGTFNPDANLIVNYLPSEMNEPQLRDLFSQIGAIKSCKLMVDKWTQKSLGYGFVEYVHPQDAESAIRTLDGKKIQNKTLKVSLARPSSAVITKANLYVKGLPLTMSEQDLSTYFGPYGHIINVRILRNGEGGPSKGVGFVRFDKRAEAEAAINALNGSVPPGGAGPLQIKFADDNQRAKTPYPPQGFNPQMGMGMGYGGMPYGYPAAGYPANPAALYSAPPPFTPPNPAAYGGQPAADPYSMAYSQGQYGAPPHAPGYPPTGPDPNAGGGMGGAPAAQGGYALFVYNIPTESDEGLLYRLFGPYGAVSAVKVIRDHATNQCKGFGFVTMGNYSEALQAIAHLNGQVISGNRPLQVSFKTDKK